MLVVVPILFGVVGVLVAAYILVAVAESSGCVHLEDVQAGSPIVQVVQIGWLVEDKVMD